jgi:hypothetical protein
MSPDGKLYLSEVATLDELEIVTIINSKARIVKVVGEQLPSPSKLTKNKVYICQDNKTIIIYPVDVKPLLRLTGNRDKKGFQKEYNEIHKIDTGTGEKKAIENYEGFIHRRPDVIENKKFRLGLSGPLYFVGLAERLIYRTSKANDQIKRHDHKYEKVAGVLVNGSASAIFITQNEISPDGIKT